MPPNAEIAKITIDEIPSIFRSIFFSLVYFSFCRFHVFTQPLVEARWIENGIPHFIRFWTYTSTFFNSKRYYSMTISIFFHRTICMHCRHFLPFYP